MTKLYKWQSTIMDEQGLPLKGVIVQIRHEMPDLHYPLACLYADQAGNHLLGNPIISGDKGEVSFFVVRGAYRVVATIGTRIQRIWRYVGIGLITELTKDNGE
jgi:hypothetical protein